MADLQAEIDRLRDGDRWAAPAGSIFELEAPADLRGKRALDLDFNGGTVVSRAGAFTNAGDGCCVRHMQLIAPWFDVREAAAAWARECAAKREAAEREVEA